MVRKGWFRALPVILGVALVCGLLVQPAGSVSAATIPVAGNGAPATIPALANWSAGTGSFSITSGLRIVANSPQESTLASSVAQDFSTALGSSVSSVVAGAKTGDLLLKLDSSRTDLGEEGYQLVVGSSISITAVTEQGLYYGTRTALQWATIAKLGGTIPAGQSVDIPKYAERGVGICACQIQVSPETIKRSIEEMSYYKLNQLWIETKVASQAYPKANFWAYFTPAEAKDLDQFAKAHYVTLVAQVNSPGHMGPWLQNYPDFQLTNSSGEKQPTRLDITKPEALTMVKTLFDEYSKSIDTPYWHMGADEYMLGSAYSEYPQIGAAAQSKFGPNAQPIDLFIDFINQVDDYVQSKGKTLRIWNDGIPAEATTVKLNKDIVVEHWLNKGKTPAQLLADGNNIMNSAYALYLIRGGGAINVQNLWDSNWTPLTFDGSTVPANAGPGKVTGAKLTLWPDNGAADTENQMEAKMHPALRFLAQSTWGSPRPTATLADFNALGDALGNGPGWQNVNYRPIADGRYRISTGAQAVVADTTQTRTIWQGQNSWQIKATSDGYYTLDNGVGQCLTVVGKGSKLWLGVPLDNGVSPQLTRCGNNNLQKWWIKKVGNQYRIVNAITLLPLVANAGRVSQQDPNKTPATLFDLKARPFGVAAAAQ